VIPTRYPGSEGSRDPQIRLGRKTEWLEDPPGVFTGLGQRMYTTDGGDHPLLDVRTVLVGPQPAA
jgi:type VI secretion system protein ImpE